LLRFCDTAGLRFAGVGYRPSHEHPASHVNKRQAAPLGLLSQPCHGLLDPLRLGGLLDAPFVHLPGAGVAGTVWRGSDADAGQQFF